MKTMVSKQGSSVMDRPPSRFEVKKAVEGLQDPRNRQVAQPLRCQAEAPKAKGCKPLGAFSSPIAWGHSGG